MEMMVKFGKDLSGNFQELEDAAKAITSKYKGLVYTEDQIASAKADRATLNRYIRDIDEGRKNVKAQYELPLKDFEKKCKAVTAILKEASDEIDTQVKSYEANEKAKKITAIEKYWTESLEKVFQGSVKIPLANVMDDKWLNKGCKEKDWKQAIDSQINQVWAGIETIKNFDERQRAFILPMFLENVDIGKCLAAYQEKEDRERKAAELKAKMDAEKAEADARRAAEKKSEQVTIQNIYEAQNKNCSMTVKLSGTADMLHEVSDFLRSKVKEGLLIQVLSSER